MARRRRRSLVNTGLGGETGTISEVNMTPLVDLSFLLLITFIITIPLMEQGLSVRLPRAQADPLPKDVQTRRIEIDRTGAVSLDGAPATLDLLEQMLRDSVAQTPSVGVELRGDQTLLYARLCEVLERVRKGGVTRVALVTASNAPVVPVPAPSEEREEVR